MLSLLPQGLILHVFRVTFRWLLLLLNVGLDADYDVIWVYLENKNEAHVNHHIYALATYFAPLSLMLAHQCTNVVPLHPPIIKRIGPVKATMGTHQSQLLGAPSVNQACTITTSSGWVRWGEVSEDQEVLGIIERSVPGALWLSEETHLLLSLFLAVTIQKLQYSHFPRILFPTCSGWI